MTVVIEVFTSPTCVYCPQAKKVVSEIASENDKVVVFEHSSATEEGRARAQEFGIQSVPTIFISNPGNSEITAFRGSQSKNVLLEEVNRRLKA